MYDFYMYFSVDTDVVVFAISLCYSLPNLEELFVAFVTGKHFKIIPVHEIAKSLTSDVCSAHSLTNLGNTFNIK